MTDKTLARPDLDPQDINFSFSLIRHLKKSPWHAVHAKRFPKPSTDEQLWNLAIEHICQEPDTFDSLYTVYKPDKEYSKPKASKHYKEMVAQHERGHLLMQREYDVLRRIRDAFYRNEWLSTVYDKRLNFSTQEKLEQKINDGLNVKGYPDLLNFDIKLTNDIKVVKDASDKEAIKITTNRDYHAQAAKYRWLCSQQDWPLQMEYSAITFIEPTPPYGINVIELDEQQLAIGHDIFMHYLGIWMDCRANNYWPSYPLQAHKVEFPAWYMRQHYNDQY